MGVGTSRFGTSNITSPDYQTYVPVYSETIKRVLAFPLDTNIVWKSHDDSIAQRSAIDQARQDKGAGGGTNHHATSKRRQTMSEDAPSEKPKGPNP